MGAFPHHFLVLLLNKKLILLRVFSGALMQNLSEEAPRLIIIWNWIVREVTHLKKCYKMYWGMRHKLSGIIFTTHFSVLKHPRMISTDACYRKFPHTEILTGCYRFDSSCGFGCERLILAFPAPNTFSLSSQCDRFLSDFSSYGWHLSSTPTCCQNYLELSGVEEAVFAEVDESIGDSILCLKGFLSEYLVLIAILS